MQHDPSAANPSAMSGSADGLPFPRRFWAILTLALGLAMAVLTGSLAILALPTIAREFQVTASEAIWVANAYQLAVTMTLLPLASLGEKLGYRRVYLWGLVLFTLASGACALAQTMPQLVLARVIQGFGAAGVMKRQHRADPLHLPLQPARPRCRLQRHDRRHHLRPRPLDRLGDPGRRRLAHAVRR